MPTVAGGCERGGDRRSHGDAGEPVGDRVGFRRSRRIRRSGGCDPIEKRDDVLRDGVGPLRMP
jgi:hypothetical protein